jgi:Fe-S-cluster containining protein
MSTSILISPGTRFTCIPCGFCCGFCDIHIDRQRKDSLELKDWVRTQSHDLEERKHQSLFKILGQGDQWLIQRRRGFCSFLDDHLLCSIHATEGFDAKPLVCQQYPNIYFRTPRGIEVFLDHSCPEVVRNTGETVTPEAIARTLPREYVQDVGPTFHLSSTIDLEWEAYLQLEEVLLQVLKLPLTYEARILCLNELACELGVQLANHKSATVKEVKEILTRILSADMREVISRIGRVPANPSKRDLYLAILLQWVESTFSGEVGHVQIGSGRVIKNILKQWKGIGEHSFVAFKFRVSFNQMREVDFDAQAETVKDALDRYLRYQIKTLVGAGKIPITKRLAITATNFALVRWLSRAYAASNGRSQVVLEDVVFGIKIVEKFLSNRLFNKLSEQRTFLSNYINFLFENPTLPGTMLSRP